MTLELLMLETNKQQRFVFDQICPCAPRPVRETPREELINKILQASYLVL